MKSVGFWSINFGFTELLDADYWYLFESLLSSDSLHWEQQASGKVTGNADSYLL